MRTYTLLAQCSCFVLNLQPMAIYHFRVQIIKRSEGRNAVASAAYRHAAKYYDEKEQRHFDYSNKEGVILSEVLIPKNSPQWLESLTQDTNLSQNEISEKLWNLVEKTEKRIDAQLSREIEFALPLELTQDQNTTLAREYINDQLVMRGMVADWSIHWDEGNPHVHIMLTMRELTQDGFGKKIREWDSKLLVNELREKWAEYANFHLRLHQHDVRIDHRSYKDQGIDLLPTIHLGKAVCDMHRRGIKTEMMYEYNEIAKENLSRITSNPNILLDKIASQSATFDHRSIGQELGKYINTDRSFNRNELGILSDLALNDLNSSKKEGFDKAILDPELESKIFASIEHHESVFTERHLAKALETYTKNADQFAKALIQTKSSSELIYLGIGDDGRDRYTTRKMFDIENNIQEIADLMNGRAHSKIHAHKIENILESYQNKINKRLTEEQLQAVNHILKPASISCLVGRAGTGKSFSLGAAKEVWERQGLNVYGVALSGIAADGLSKDAKIPSRTIESFRYALKNERIKLDQKSIVVMDEAGMTDSLSMKAILDAVNAAKSKLVLVGDHAQIQPVGPGASFRALIERLGFAEIHTVYRQKEQWQRDATVALSAGRVKDGLIPYIKQNCIHFELNHEKAMHKLASDWFTYKEQYKEKQLSEFLVIAHRNDDVSLLNSLIRQERINRNEIAEGYEVSSSQHGTFDIANGDRLLFLKNDRSLGVSNGRFATIKTVNFTESGKVIDFIAVLDGSNKEVKVDPLQYNDFNYGYAATVHKVQGMTVDHALVYAGGKGWNRNLTYVAMSRHRDTCHMYVDKTDYPDNSGLIKGMSKLGIKDSLLDFPLAFSERRGLEIGGLLKILPHHLANKLLAMKDKVKDQIELIINPNRYYKNKEEEAQTKQHAEFISSRREDAKLVAEYIDANKELGAAWKALQIKLHDVGIHKMTYECKSFEIISNTKEYKDMQNATINRDRLASEIMHEPWRYQKAAEIYGIDFNKLMKLSNNYKRIECVKEYINYYTNSKIVLRDQIAGKIQSNIKEYYSNLKKMNVDTSELRKNAISHLRRDALKKMTPNERESFRTVEVYQKTFEKIGKLCCEIKANSKELLKTHDLVKRIEDLSSKRDQLAYEVMKDKDKYETALNFYQIGSVPQRFNETTTTQHFNKAEIRLHKLQQASARYKLNISTKYQEGSSVNNEIEKPELKSMLLKYVSMEVEQDNLVTNLYEARLNKLDCANDLGKKSVELNKDIQKYAHETIKHPEISKLITQHTKSTNISSLGGYKAIQERILNATDTKEDLEAIAYQISNKAREYQRSYQLDRERDRGGRSR